MLRASIYFKFICQGAKCLVNECDWTNPVPKEKTRLKQHMLSAHVNFIPTARITARWENLTRRNAVCPLFFCRELYKEALFCMMKEKLDSFDQDERYIKCAPECLHLRKRGSLFFEVFLNTDLVCFFFLLGDLDSLEPSWNFNHFSSILSSLPYFKSATKFMPRVGYDLNTPVKLWRRNGPAPVVSAAQRVIQNEKVSLSIIIF